jgi:CheY-like chemotaxis protein
MSRILVVDDEPLIRAFLAEELAETGYHVATATNGAEALACVQADPTDLVLLDLLMPLMDGLEFLSERAAHPRLAKIPVVVLSAAGIDGLRDAQQLHATAVLGKPVDLDVLAHVIEHVLEQWRPVSPAVATPRRSIGTCPICGVTVYAAVDDGLATTSQLAAIRAARRAHVRTHSDADILQAPLHRKFFELPAGDRRILARWIYHELRQNWGDQDRRGVHSIASVLDAPAIHRLWHDAVRCSFAGCRH